MAHREKDLELDLENGPIDCEEEAHYNKKAVLGLKKKAQMFLANVKGSPATEGSDDDGGVSSSHDSSNSGRVHVENVEGRNNIKDDDAKENILVKEKRKSLSKTKPPKPPRPPRSPSLDAADQKLIRELADLARLKRARSKRTNALKNMKIPKGSSSSSNMLVLGLTVVLCLVLLFRGMSSKGTLASFEGSRVPVKVVEGVRSSVQFLGNQPAVIRNRSNSRSRFLVDLVAGLAADGKMRRVFG